MAKEGIRNKVGIRPGSIGAILDIDLEFTLSPSRPIYLLGHTSIAICLGLEHLASHSLQCLWCASFHSLVELGRHVYPPYIWNPNPNSLFCNLGKLGKSLAAEPLL